MSSYATIGTAVTATGLATSTVFTTNTVLNVGELGVSRYTCGAAARPTGITCTDSAGNTWAIAIDGGDGLSSYNAIFWTVATVQLASSGTITVATTASQQFRGLDAIKCANPSSSTPLDSPPTKFGSGSGTAVSAGASVAPATSDWVGATVVAYNGSAMAPGTVGGTWIEDADVSAVGFQSQSLIGTSTTAVGGGGTQTGANPWSCAIAVFSLGAAAVVGTPGSRTAIPFTQGAGGGAFGGGGPH